MVNRPRLWTSLTPVALLIILLVINVKIFKDEATAGPNQIALLLAAGLCVVLAFFIDKKPYLLLEKQALKSIGMSLQANLILLVVGSLIGTWILSGVVPAMIFYGVKILNPLYFLPLSCLICCFVALATGSSWSTGGTLGIALIGIGQTLGIPLEMVAGAVISGSYFGDKLSPLSDTTNLAPAMAGAELFAHIRHMLYTTIPAIILSLILFYILGLTRKTAVADISEIQLVLSAIEQNFSIGIHLFLIPLMVLVMVSLKFPALPALAIGAVLGGLGAYLFQYELLQKLDAASLKEQYQLIMSVAYRGFQIDSGNPIIDKLFSRGGMESMLSTVWLIICAMFFGGMMEATGYLQRIANAMFVFVKDAASLIAVTVTSCVFLNITASDQYLSIVVSGRMFREFYQELHLDPRNLSRALEDGGTVTSVLVPWNSGGAYFAGILGVATLDYLPYCFFNLLSPIISIFFAVMGWTIIKLGKNLERQSKS